MFRHNHPESGSSLIEFALCCLVMMPLFMGTCGVGLALIRQIMVSQVSRDAARMYAKGIDFSTSQSANRLLITRIAKGLGITQTSPGKVVIWTGVTYITKSDCQAASLNDAQCTNLNRCVMTKRIRLGDGNLPSELGEPVQVDAATGAINRNSYLTNTANRTAYFPPAIAQFWSNQNQSGLVAYVAEVRVASTDLQWTGFAGQYTTALSLF